MEKETHKQAVKRGKKSRAAGAAFEKRVRLDLESEGGIVDKWTNNVELTYGLESDEKQIPYKCKGKFIGKLIPAKPKFVYNPILKRRVMMGNSSGFPDFVCFKIARGYMREFYEVIGVESKMDGKLDKAEKEKCKWLLENQIFSKILIANKIKIGRSVGIDYKEFLITAK